MISSDFCEEVTCKASNYNKSFLSSCSYLVLLTLACTVALGAESSMKICSLYPFTPVVGTVCPHWPAAGPTAGRAPRKQWRRRLGPALDGLALCKVSVA